MSAKVFLKDAMALWLSIHSRFLSWAKRRHGHRRMRARWTAARILSIKGADDRETIARRVAYLRKIDPWVFEELVLDAFQRRGWTVVRNHRYTGDGDLDGRIYADGVWSGVQCKRYKGDVPLSMITRFARDLRREGLTRGFFIHTGRVTREALDNVPQGIVILSPVDLVRWIGREDFDQKFRRR